MVTFSKLGQYGRFGNQLWQIASTIGIANKNEMPFSFLPWEYQKYFRNKLPQFTVEYAERIVEPDTFYHDFVLQEGKFYDLEGYFQSWKYFDHCKNLVRHYLEPVETLGYLGHCAVHVRRGDYVSLSHIHINLTMDYYAEAMSLFPEDTQFLVYSDDILWCKKNFPKRNVQFIYNTDPMVDFVGMLGSQDFIIANSSFSWWAAWLSKSEGKKVVCPSRWVTNEPIEVMDDRVPKEWIRI